jgi:hypothetical protein
LQHMLVGEIEAVGGGPCHRRCVSALGFATVLSQGRIPVQG